MRRDDSCDRRAAAGEAGAAYVSEREPECEPACVGTAQDGPGQSFGRATFCRAGFAGRGTTVARSMERHTLAFALDPTRSVGSIS
jgi:hypothetical protein